MTAQAFPRGTLLPDGRLDLCKQRVGAAGVRVVATALRGHPQVRHLLLGANGLGDAGAAAVAELVRDGQLETIYLGCNFITAAGASELAAALTAQTNVRGLWLKRNPIGLAGVRALAVCLPQCPALRTLDLTQTGLTTAGLADLVAALTAAASGVERLYLCGNRLGPEVAALLAQLLAASPRLRHLYVSVNRLGDAGVRRLAVDGLARNQTLESLSLASNGIGPDGAAALAEAVGAHPALRVLELGRQPAEPILGEQPNAIGDGGAAAFAEILPGHATLAVLDLSHNGVTDAGAAALADGLAGNQTLVELTVGKEISRGRRRQIEGMLRRPTPPAAPVHGELLAIRSVYRTAAPEAQHR